MRKLSPTKSNYYRTSPSAWKQTKKPPDVGGFNFWYSVLREYRANNIKEIDDLYRLIENLSFQSQLEQVI